MTRFSLAPWLTETRFGGFSAWLAWLFLHLIYLVGFRARLTTTLSWIGTFIGSQRDIR